MTKDILRKHSHVSSFGAIQRDCEDTVRRLQDKLQEEVNSSVSRTLPVFGLCLCCVCGVFILQAFRGWAEGGGGLLKVAGEYSYRVLMNFCCCMIVRNSAVHPPQKKTAIFLHD